MSRYVLGFDTATEAIAVALARWPSAEQGEPELLGEGDLVAPRASLSGLLPAIETLLGERGLEPGDLELVVVGRGPGSYTGVRIGLAAAKGLAQGLGVPLLGVGTLDAIAWGLSDEDGRLAVVGDAMRQEVYPALFGRSGGRVSRETPDTVEFPADVAARWAAEDEGPLTLAGDGLAKHADVFVSALGDRVRLAPRDTWLPTGRGVLAAAWAAQQGGRTGADPAWALPVYTRLSDAEHREPGRGRSVPECGVAGPNAAEASGAAEPRGAGGEGA